MIGAVVGVLVSALVAPPLYVRPAGAEVHDMAQATADLLRRMAEDVEQGYGPERAQDWLAEARQLDHGIVRVDATLTRADESARLNPRTLPHAPRGRASVPVPRQRAKVTLRSGLDALERVAVSVRGVSRILADRAREEGPPYPEEVRQRLARTLRAIADAVDAFGALVRTEVVGGEAMEPALTRALTDAWRELSELSQALRSEGSMDERGWELHGALVAQLGRLLRDIDVEHRVRMREEWQREDEGRRDERRQLRTLRRRRSDREAPL
jgi:hypothetical protein